MRVPEPALYYRPQTKDIVNRTFQPWQLIVRDQREGLHRLINRIVSLADELHSEARYIESMFFPDSCDMSEPYEVSTFVPARLPEQIRVNGTPLTELYPEASSLDEFLAGLPTHYRTHHTVTTVAHDSLSMTHSDAVYLVGASGAVYCYNARTDTESMLRTPDMPQTETMRVVVDDHRTFLITKPASNVAVTTPSGAALPFSLNTTPGNYNPDFDVDGDGVIGEYERSLVAQAYGARMEDVSLATWNQIGWCDIDGDGYVSDRDVTIVHTSIPSFDPTAFAAVSIGSTYRGEAIITYVVQTDVQYTAIADVLGSNPQYKVPDALRACRALSYDATTDVYYVVDNATTLRAVKLHPTLGNVLNDSLLHVPLWVSGEIMDVDVCGGFLYVLMSDGTQHMIGTAFIHGEYVAGVDATAPLECPFAPRMLGVGSDGLVVVSDGTTLGIVYATRERYIAIENSTYVSAAISGEVVDTEGTPLAVVPHKIFNNFDSFAYSLGILRPPGRDNWWMREAIYDFFRHRQGNHPIGITYHTMRGCGVIPDTYYSYPRVVTSPVQFALDQPMVANGMPMTVTSGAPYRISADGIVCETAEGMHFVVIELSGECTISGSVYDGNGDLRGDSFTISVPDGVPYESAPIHCVQGDDRRVLSTLGYYSGDVPTQVLLDLMCTRAQSEPTVWKNAIPGRTPVKALRASVDPVVPTVYAEDYMRAYFQPDDEVIV